MNRTLFTCWGFGVFALAATLPAAESDATALVGTWKVIEYKDDNIDQRGRIGMTKAAVEKGDFAKLVFTQDECWLVLANGKRDVIKGLTNCAFKRYTLKPASTPQAVELIGFSGIDGGDVEVVSVGIVKVEDGKLWLCWNEGGYRDGGVDRPANQGKKLPTKFESDGEMNLLVCEWISDKPEEKPRETNAIVPKK